MISAPQSSSASRLTAGAFGFLTLTQNGGRRSGAPYANLIGRYSARPNPASLST